jgi:hypothetical protein
VRDDDARSDSSRKDEPRLRHREDYDAFAILDDSFGNA